MFFRKQWRAKPILHPESPPASDHPSKSSKDLLSLSKASPVTSVISDDQAEDVKGSLGLSLLFSPAEPEIDFIFVHGLGGSSRKTWSKSPLKSHFWPKEWLSKDPAFRNVRIHSYGYDSYYLKGRENCLNIHHIGKSFLGAISSSPSIANSGTAIVVIGHSMGGLVTKKAFILAKQDAVHKDLSGRFAAFYFLATPHRGSDWAKMLKTLLKVAFHRAYVGDLEPNSEGIQVINDEFRHISAGLELWSFYETQKMKLFSSLIVDPESAVLGYREERQIPMAADHRTICKFDTPEDSNYTQLRNALASTVSMIHTANVDLKRKQVRERTKDLRMFLKIPDVLDDDLENVREARLGGSCKWISTKADYIKWRDGEFGAKRHLWIKGRPATGKSVLSGYIVDQLKESGQACSYFFFRHGDKSKSNLGCCLRSLAFQMASSHTEAGDTILGMQADGVCLDSVDERTLWRMLFLSSIFQVPTTRHFWVIDALDECSNPAILFNIFSNMGESIPLRILVTSRDTVDLAQRFSIIPPNLVQSFSISETDTESDISLLIERKTQSITVVGPNDQGTLAEKILDKSKGSFLWTILVLEELLCCHSKKEIHQILQDVPRGMMSLYKRTLNSMSQATRGKKLAQTILMWAVCAIRPMTIGELDGALTLEIHDSFPILKESIAALCGQLVVVDKYGRINMVHETAREYLVADGLDSEFSIDKSKAHTRMAHVCLKYLAGKEMKPPRNTRRRSSANLPAKRLDFAAYACKSFSYHLSRADPSATETFQLVVQFLQFNVLTWIEMIADCQNLNHLIRASKHLKAYVNACATERSPLEPRIRDLRQWIADLARIPAMFANALMVSPSSIYSLIPPFCPTESMIYTTGVSSQRLTVIGALMEQWDDRLLCIAFRQGQPRALRYGDEFLAVGLSSGSVVLYYVTSYQEYKVLEHGEGVDFIAFTIRSGLLATCGRRMVKVWDIRSGEVMHSFPSLPRPLAMDFDGETLLIASGNNYIASWHLGHNVEPTSVRVSWCDTNTPETNQTLPRGSPCALTLSTSHRILAVAYSGQPIILWDMEEDVLAGSCGKKLSSGETSTHVVVALAFNPNPDISLLAVSYLDGDLALLDPFTDQQLICFRANCQTLASSPNGHLLAAGGADGIIQVYEFDTFKLLYRVKSSISFIKQFAFTRDSVPFADIRGTQCTVWGPEALLRESLSDGSGGTTFTTVVETASTEAKAKITAMAIHHMSEIVFCGKNDGSVVLYERKMAGSLGTLYSHKSPVRLLVWIERRDSLLSVDASNRIFLHKIQKSADKGWPGDLTVLFKSHLRSEEAIRDVLVGELAGKLLVSTRESNHLFNLNSGQYEREQPYPKIPGTRKWLQHPDSSLHLVCVYNVEICTYCWSDWSEVSSLALPLNKKGTELKSATLYSLGPKRRIMLDLLHPGSSTNINRIVIIEADCLSIVKNDNSVFQGKHLGAAVALGQVATDEAKNLVTTSSLATPIYLQMTTFELGVAHVIGIHESKLVFLNQSFWVCSVDISESRSGIVPSKDPAGTEVCEHFFVPCDWFAGKRDIVCALANRDIMLTRGGDLAVIRGGLDYAERMCIGSKAEVKECLLPPNQITDSVCNLVTHVN